MCKDSTQIRSYQGIKEIGKKTKERDEMRRHLTKNIMKPNSALFSSGKYYDHNIYYKSEHRSSTIDETNMTILSKKAIQFIFFLEDHVKKNIAFDLFDGEKMYFLKQRRPLPVLYHGQD